MPYTEDMSGIYKIVNHATGACYVGQSLRMKKRLKEHFRLLRRGIHSNPRLQKSYDKHGEANFSGSMEIFCEDPNDMDIIENAFLTGEARFVEPVVYNIADFAKIPMRGRRHSEEAKQRIRAGRRSCAFDFQSPEYRKTLSKAQTDRFFQDSKFVAKLRYIVDNPHLSYAERARALKSDTSSVRKLAIKYAHMKGTL